MPLHPEAKLLWESIRNPNCTECPLHEEAQTVCLVGDGPVPADIMIVGEAPGYREDEISKPFSGKSGRLLDDALTKVGLKREDCFITNTVKCRPPENATPNKTQQKACRHYLDDEIEAVQPKFMLLLGNVALSVIKKSGITKHRGNFYELGDIQVFPTVHPALVLRNPRWRQVFESDMQTFSRLVRGRDVLTAPPRVFLIRDSTGLATVCDAIMKSDAVAYDIETNGFDEMDPDGAIATVAVSPKPGISFVVPVHHPSTPWKDPSRALRILVHALAYTPARRVAHNAKFDDKWLSYHAGAIHADFDTMIAAHVLDENRFKGLKVLAPMLLGVNPWADVDLAGGGAMREDLKRLAIYNGRDTDYTLRLYHLFRSDLKHEGNERSLRLFAKLLMPASAALTDIEAQGMWIDTERLAERRIAVHKKLRIINKKLVKMAGTELNWNSTQQLAKFLFGELKLPMPELTAKGNPSTRESVLLQLQHEHEAPALILEWRKFAKYESTYLGKWSGVMKNSRIYPNYKITGTVTGRLSSGKEEAKDPRVGVQQVPRDDLIRGVIGAPPGWKFVEADFSQVELRIAAHYSQDRTMMRLFHAGEDIHLATAVQITGKHPKDITKEERKKAKAVNFGFLYGMGHRKFVIYARDNYGVVVSEVEARAVRDRFFDTFRGLHPWHDRQRRLVQQYGRVQSAIGRVRHLPDIDSEDKEVRGEAERQAINSPVQSLASDMMLLAMVILHEELPRDEAVITGTVHDSLLFEIREDRVAHWAPYIKNKMENLPLKKKFGASLTVPIIADVKVGDHWGEGEEVA